MSAATGVGPRHHGPRQLELHVRPLPVAPDLDVAELVRRLSHRARVTAWSGRWSHGALVTCDPGRVVRTTADRARRLLAAVPAAVGDPAHPHAVGGGWFGYLAYPDPGSENDPASSFGWYRDVLRHDGYRWWYEALLGESDEENGEFDVAWAEARRAALARDAARPSGPAPSRLRVRTHPDQARHLAAVEKCQQAIRRGEIYQANIATVLDLELTGSPHEAWARLVQALRPARAALVADPFRAAVSASPELFLHREGRRVRTEPIKGTRPRVGVAADSTERARLSGSEKEAAENVMIVDLMRNDLARVCDTGSVTVPRLLDVQAHPGVWHLVSTVHGELGPGRDDADLLGATFPPGSVTGTPKLRAVEIIGSLEEHRRGLFTGALGYVGPLAGLEMAVTIRTLQVESDGRARLGVGGGITADSDPAAEWRECLHKAAPLLRVLDAELHRSPLDRPDPRATAGLVETVTVVDGRAPLLDLHLARLRRGFAEHFGSSLTADVRAAVAAAAGSRAGPSMARVVAVPQYPDQVAVSVTHAARPYPADAELTVQRVGAHWLGMGYACADRSHLEGIELITPAGAEPLLVDVHGRVLETPCGGVVMVRRGIPIIPPLDGRVRPWIGRQRLLDALDDAGMSYDIAPVRLADLSSAQGLLLLDDTGGIRRVRRVLDLACWPEPCRDVSRVVHAFRTDGRATDPIDALRDRVANQRGGAEPSPRSDDTP